MNVSEDTVEFWVRNAKLYMAEALECDQLQFVWDLSYLVKHKQISDIHKYMSLKCRGRKFQYIVVSPKEASLHDADHDRTKPLAVWPVWYAELGNTIHQLETWMANPVGRNRTLCNDKSVSSHCRPVWGQSERIIVDPGSLASPNARANISMIRDLQEEYPDVKIHLHGTGSFKYGFGLNFGAFDFEAHTLAQRGQISLPNGKQLLRPTDYPLNEEWIRLCGFTPRRLTEKGRNRTMFNIKSGQWAAENYRQNVKWKTRGFETEPGQKTSKRTWFKKQKPVETDMLSCYKCSMQLACKYYREGSVCSVPGSEGEDLAKMFKTRDSEVIIDALSNLLSRNVARLENAMDNEADKGEVDPHVTRLVESIWDRGERLAKLLDPELGHPTSKTSGNINFLNVNMAKSPQELASAVFAELEAQGVARDQITPELVENLMAMSADEKKKAINVLAVGSGPS